MATRPSRAEIAEYLDYDPDNGTFTRTKACRPQSIQYLGAANSRPNSNGYILVRVNGRRWRAHQLAWLLMTGEWPSNDIDHINGNRIDNRWINLRAATRSQNLQNQRRRKDNSSGIKGVSFDRDRGKWTVQLSVNRRHVFIGRFETKDEASIARAQAAVKHFGEFAREGAL